MEHLLKRINYNPKENITLLIKTNQVLYKHRIDVDIYSNEVFTMKDFIVVSPETEMISDLEKQNRALARQVAAEGFVLLHNNGVLPLKEKSIALFGTGARMTVYGGTGSGETKGRQKVSIEQGLKNSGAIIESTLWLDEFDAKYNRERKLWKEDVEEHIKGYHLWNVMDMFREIDKHHFVFPVGDAITEKHIKGKCNTAIYIIARQAGEGGDRKLEAGDYYLSQVEVDSIRLLKNSYKQVVVMINSGGSVDCSFMDDEDTRPDALIYIGQPGEEAGNAVADILFGQVSPSGHLTSTWAKDYYDFPGAKEYAHIGKNAKEANYKEGIYVGYRWFQANHIEPRFAFGYGLSYTTFEHNYLGICQCDNKLVCKFRIKNTGDKYPGKDVIGVYAAKTKTRTYQVKQELVGFAKTRELNPGEEEILDIEVNIQDLTSFVAELGGEFLLSGEYVLSEGASVDCLKPMVSVVVNEDYQVKKMESLASCQVNFEENIYDVQDDQDLNLPQMVIDTSLLCKDVEKHVSQLEEPSDMVKELSDNELCTMLAGGPVVSYGYVRTPGTVGRTSNILWDKYKLPSINMADGPAGLNLIPQSLITKRGMEKSYQHLPENWSFGFLPKLEWLAVGNPKKDRMVCQFTTAFPCTTVRAQTWNRELQYRVGAAVGQEMQKFGITLWLAPAINIQKNPLCGRNFEYASEDPLLSGYMAASIIDGVQHIGGVGVTIKHFCANNQETEREYMSANISERALRQIYLKGFEIAIRESEPWSVMTSYNKLNGTYTANNRELLINVLRKEWGYKGVIMTDWGAITKDKGDYYQCANNGNDLIMPGDNSVVKQLVEDLKVGRLNKTSAQISVDRVLKLVRNSNFVK